mmetsp:Transcript_20394/g.32413  ORF Transcript_20394/g.32413 Transcript_20394/m.32413 type:complete len:282 (-) Transcript_20394:140-985(-)|eukprot:CAMPEP_0197031062 /NCGR_PEP_ID=MMETSP1384-20130603/10175_1 /TAXON_ID=29189 /ORGANISM="Ammonia sp." /LENGTH=281 /DNA_ID=CAMNT_0042460539 /DNA_START=61 /DNA_END=906 /DNA_ORIENTATION=+
MFATEDPEPHRPVRTEVNLVDLFKPNAGCTDLMYTLSGDYTQNIPLQQGIHEHHHQDVKDLNHELHSTINHNEDIIPPHTLLPSVTNLFTNRLRRRHEHRMREFDPDIDGTDIPQFAKPSNSNPFEFCIVRAVLSTAMGYVGGAFFALFINAFQNPVPWELQDKLTTKEQLVYSYKDLWRNMKRLGKQMAIIGGLYGGIECYIERKRAKQDIDNHLYTGCLTGGILGAAGGPYACVMGCGGFAAFSWVIEMYMDASHEPEHQDDENTKNYQLMLQEDMQWV